MRARKPHESTQAGKIQLDGDTSVLGTYAGLLDTFDHFNIVTPDQRQPLDSQVRAATRGSDRPIDVDDRPAGKALGRSEIQS